MRISDWSADVCSSDLLPQGEAGDVWCRGPGIMKGYYRAPDLTAQAITPDGWLITGDVGRFDEDDSLHIVGRSKELIIRSGFNIYPPEVEDRKSTRLNSSH